MIRIDRNTAFWVLLAATFVGACEPASITEARNQLRRGGSRAIQFNMPLADTSVTVDVGSKLKFDALSFDADPATPGYQPFTYSFNQMLQTTQQTASITFPAPPITGAAPTDIYPAAPPPTHFGTAGGSTVESATVGSGYVVRAFTNGTGCAVTVNTSLTDSLGATVAAFPSNVVVNNGASLLDSISAAGVTVTGFAQVGGNASTGICIPSNPNISVGVTFRPLTLSSVVLRNVNESFNQTYNAFSSEPRITAVDTVVVASRPDCGPLPSCTFSISVQNRLPIADNITVRLDGITKAGLVQQQNIVVPAANGAGGTTSGTLTFDLAGARIIPVAVIPRVTGTATATTATITPTNATNAVLVSGGGSLVIQSISGKLNPAETPELKVSLENSQALPDISSDFGNLSNETSVDSATAKLDIVNTSGAPIQLSNFGLRAAQTDTLGQPLKDGAGNVIYEKNASGQVIILSVADPGTTTFTVGRATTKSVSIAATPLLDRVLHMLLDNKRVALVATGMALVGDNSQSTISRTDFVKIRFRLTVGVTITTPGPQ